MMTLISVCLIVTYKTVMIMMTAGEILAIIVLFVLVLV